MAESDSDFIAEANDTIKLLVGESDRGAVIVGVAYLDELLKRVFRAHMTGIDPEVEKRLFGAGPLGNFSARIDLAFAFGWIGKGTHRDLNLVRKIRNEFAHLHNEISFGTPSVQNRCRELGPARDYPVHLREARDQFLWTVRCLILGLNSVQDSISPSLAAIDPPDCGPPEMNGQG